MPGLTLVIGNKNYSSWSLRPWLFMKHHKMDFMEKRIALFTPTTDTELEQYGSDYKVPILLDGDLTIWDSMAILEYLSEQYLDGGGWPADRSVRAMARSISNEMHSSYVNVRSEMPFNVRRQFSNFTLSPGAQREVVRIGSLWRQCRKLFGSSGPWLFGQFSIADAMFAPIALRLNTYGICVGDVEQNFVETILNDCFVQQWIEAGRQETEVIEISKI